MMAEDIKGTEINPGVFPQRLIIALKKNGMTRKELAERIGVTPQSIGRYAKSESLPTADILRDIAVCLDVSCDWLVGLSEVSSTEVDVQAVCSSTVLNEESAKLLMPKYMRVEDYYLTPSMREDIISILKQKEIDEASDEMIDALFLGMVEDAFREGVFEVKP